MQVSILDAERRKADFGVKYLEIRLSDSVQLLNSYQSTKTASNA